MRIFWTDFATSELRKIHEYYLEEANIKIAENETRKIAEATLILKDQPEIGQVEPLLARAEPEFRYLVHQSFKIIYWINRERNQVEVVDVFHTRQYPKKMLRKK
ncbi:MAG: type II toxin-antitoxin system RelE/ParE family toxin [Cryomorphaceae bacterium]